MKQPWTTLNGYQHPCAATVRPQDSVHTYRGSPARREHAPGSGLVDPVGRAPAAGNSSQVVCTATVQPLTCHQVDCQPPKFKFISHGNTWAAQMPRLTQKSPKLHKSLCMIVSCSTLAGMTRLSTRARRVTSPPVQPIPAQFRPNHTQPPFCCPPPPLPSQRSGSPVTEVTDLEMVHSRVGCNQGYARMLVLLGVRTGWK